MLYLRGKQKYRYMNLHEEEILSDEIFKAIELIVERCPHTVFGGSIALNAIGIIDRQVGDLDLFFSLGSSLTQYGLLSFSDHIISDTVTDVNGVEVQRTGAKINDVKCCCFKVEEAGLDYIMHTIKRDGKKVNIRVQNVNYAIQAKISYAKNSNNPKHQKDLKSFSDVIDKFF